MCGSWHCLQNHQWWSSTYVQECWSCNPHKAGQQLSLIEYRARLGWEHGEWASYFLRNRQTWWARAKLLLGSLPGRLLGRHLDSPHVYVWVSEKFDQRFVGRKSACGSLCNCESGNKLNHGNNPQTVSCTFVIDRCKFVNIVVTLIELVRSSQHPSWPPSVSGKQGLVRG